LNAFAPQHLALPRAVAPYTVIRTSAIYKPGEHEENRLVLFSPFINDMRDAGQWSNIYAISANVGLDSARNTANGVKYHTFGSMDTDSWLASSVTPAAFSIQVMNPSALQTTSGDIYIGRCKNKVHLSEGDNSKDFKDLAESLVSYSNPRILSAGKLALRGVHVDAVPNNMSELAKFTTLNAQGNAIGTLGTDDVAHPEGFNPIFLYNPEGVNLTVLVCCEWRVRFDPSNPAYAACTTHTPTTEAVWHRTMTDALSVGNGVVDIVEKVARVGLPLARAAGYLGG